MATWQFDFHLIPRRSLERRYGLIPKTLSQDDWDDIDWWQDQKLSGDWHEHLSRILATRKTWDNEILGWGQEDGNRVDVSVENGKPIGVYCRLDARRVDKNLIKSLAEFAEAHACVLVTETLKIIEPDSNALLKEFSQSPASRFVADPTAFLDSLSRESNSEVD